MSEAVQDSTVESPTSEKIVDNDAAPEPKKVRTSKRAKTDTAASVTAKKPSPLKGRKLGPRTSAKVASDASGKASSSAAVSTPQISAVGFLDDFAELLALEQENNQLRRSLAEKLRAENTEIRRKLGQAM